MKLVVQRVKESSVTIEGQINGRIDKGFMVLVGFCNGDNEKIIEKMVDKMIHLESLKTMRER